MKLIELRVGDVLGDRTLLKKITRSQTTYWVCRCKCGNIKEISAYLLKKGVSRECKCNKKDFKAGDKVGEWTLLSEEKGSKENNYKPKWLCVCICGNKKEIGKYWLLEGKSLHCGCLNPKKEIKRKKEETEKGERKTRAIDYTGQTLGHLTVIKRVESRSNEGRIQWECICFCGKEVLVGSNVLRNGTKGSQVSCGCTYRFRETHGLSKHPAYEVWKSMIKRCENQSDKEYINYGGRGIKVCEEWHDVRIFVKWADEIGFKKGLQIDRKNTNGNYDPGNCEFVSKEKNANNKRNSYRYEYNGEWKTAAEIAAILGIQVGSVGNKARRGQLKRKKLYE